MNVNARSYSLHQVDSFTSTKFKGNPTATIVNAQGLSDDEMKNIANEMNLSETGFVLPSSTSKAHFRLRYFTPTGDEIKFCGHATIGALCALAKDKLFDMDKPGIYQFQVETNAGILPMEVNLKNEQDPTFSFDSPRIDLRPSSYKLGDVIKALGISPDLVDFTKPLMHEHTNNYLFFAIPSLEALSKIQVDEKGAKAFSDKTGVVIFCALTPYAFDPSNHVHARGFAPAVGVPEDPFTGSMQGGLAAYLLHNKMIDPNIKVIGSEQGNFLKRPRPGQVTIELTHGTELKARLHAKAVHVFKTTLEL